MDKFKSLLDENPYVQESRAEGRVEGKAEGLQEAVVTFIEERFPPLAELAQEKVPQITKVNKLNLLLRSIYTAPDEATVRLLLHFAA